MGVMLVEPGMLLVSTPALQDPNFVDTVILLLDVNDEGVLGVILNRPSPVLVADVLDQWGGVVDEPEVLFRGGPVGLDGALAVGRVHDPDQAPLGWREVAGRLGIVDLDVPPELLSGSLSQLRVFAGYAGWGAQQLQDELAEESWYVVASEEEDVFGAHPTGLWREVLRRQPGMLAWHSTRPLDPELN